MGGDEFTGGPDIHLLEVLVYDEDLVRTPLYRRHFSLGFVGFRWARKSFVLGESYITIAISFVKQSTIPLTVIWDKTSNGYGRRTHIKEEWITETTGE